MHSSVMIIIKLENVSLIFFVLLLVWSFKFNTNANCSNKIKTCTYRSLVEFNLFYYSIIEDEDLFSLTRLNINLQYFDLKQTNLHNFLKR